MLTITRPNTEIRPHDPHIATEQRELARYANTPISRLAALRSLATIINARWKHELAIASDLSKYPDQKDEAKKRANDMQVRLRKLNSGVWEPAAEVLQPVGEASLWRRQPSESDEAYLRRGNALANLRRSLI